MHGLYRDEADVIKAGRAMAKRPAGADKTLDVVVVIPTFNEADHIGALCRGLLADPIFSAPGLAEIWVLDGGSTDDTRKIAEALSMRDPRVRLIENPGRTQAHAMNLAAEQAMEDGAATIIRVDAHAYYPVNFLSILLATLDAETCDSVVVPMHTIGGDRVRDAAADLYNSWLGNGGSTHRSSKLRGFVEHGHHAAFRLAKFREVGGYDPRFIANEDAELDKRIVASGGRIFLENAAVVDYIPRDTVAGFWSQMWRNGRFRVWTAAKHGDRLGLRQLLPVAVSLGVLGSLALGLIWWPLFAPALAYIALVTVLAAAAATRKTLGRIGSIIVLAIVSHLAFGLGAVRGMAEMAASRRQQFA
jgi:succinoglycan biosynthesis protein ExoA